MRAFKHLLLALAFLFPLIPAAKAVPALDALKSKTTAFYFVLPEPSGGRLENSPLNPARTEWLSASKKYSDKVFTPKPQHRVDTNNSRLIMLQGFHWYADNYWIHPPNGWWGVLADKAPEVGKAGFDLIWFPPVSNGSYYPKEWYNLDSQWGNRANLTRAISAMHAQGVKVVADVVLNHRNGTKDWADFTNPDWPTTAITRNDEWPGVPDAPYNGKSMNYDEGQNDSGCRDLDHKNPLVQEESKIFMRWLKNTMGFDGWRFDMVKGYAPQHIEDYNDASSPVFSVGEVYDGNRQLVANWIDGTDSSSDKVNASSAFDFPTKFNLISAIETERYETLNDNGRPSGIIGWWPAKAVTFVENHDTTPRDPNFIANASAEYKTQRLIGYAYILTHPGIPCVFWPHFFDWGQAYRNSIQTLMDIRRAAGITSTSRMAIMAATNELYAAVIDGERQRVVLKLGRNWGWNPGAGWTLAASGERYAVWTQPLP
ncbi:MAG: alpha-amylase family glycosyl hydrolase [Elusimicrobia bacterium]|nr:alpha-amylase family glycosyl hydrolase [Elusimicrobiota bacterium]